MSASAHLHLYFQFVLAPLAGVQVTVQLLQGCSLVLAVVFLDGLVEVA